MKENKAAAESPQKLYLEVTTRCNLKCSKCVKQIEGARVKESDFSSILFDKLIPALSSVQSLILNGLGEPLLHPQLPEMIRTARGVMDDDATIGFQTNGAMLTESLAAEIAEAGLSTICFSLDSLHEDPLHCSQSPDMRTTVRAIQNMHNGAGRAGASLQIGLEIVVSRNNRGELPKMVHWAAENGVDFILATHLFAYDQDMAAESIFGLNTVNAVELFRSYSEKAKNQGLDLENTLRSILRTKRMGRDERFTQLLQEMRKEAAARDIHLHFMNLLDYDEEDAAVNATIFAQAEEAAKRYNLDLRLPVLCSQHERQCPFIQDAAVFVNVHGEVMPCHFLWHSYPCMAGSYKIAVQERSFGNIQQKSLEEIWQQCDYREFRHQVLKDEYSRCWCCPQSPCSDVVNTNILDINDCHGSIVPCGHCRWSIGGLHCL